MEQKLNLHFTNYKYIKSLIYLYRLSDKECRRNNKLSPEIGSSREKNIIASFTTNPIFDIEYMIDNKYEEDCIIDNKKISIKHSSNKKNIGNGIKIIWISNKIEQSKFIKKFLFSTNLLIIWIRENELEILYVKYEILNKYHHLFNIMKKQVFKCLSGNSRGIELSKDFFKKILEKSTFHKKIPIDNTYNADNEVNCIQKRIKLLKIFEQ